VMSNKVRALVILSVLVNVWGSIFLMKSY
jgi:hypothetical protein